MIRSVRPLVLLAVMLGLSACDGRSTADNREQGHSPARDAVRKGPHGGRMLESGDFALEVQIFEAGVPPEFRLHPTFAGQPVPLEDVQATIELSRVNGIPGGKTDAHVFEPRPDYLYSPQTVYEPHSYAVKVVARHAGQTYEWRYDSPEGRVRIAADMAQANGLTTATVGSGAIRETLMLYGSIRPDAERVRAVAARFPGIVRSVPVQVGDTVRSGQTLATVESNESLQIYPVTAPIDGMVTRRSTNPGEAAAGEPLFEVADFSGVWAELTVFPRDRGRLRAGQPVEIESADGSAHGSGAIAHISPIAGDAQALTARVVLDNRDGRWTPGQFINARVTFGESPAAHVVPLSALQTFRDWDVVFVADGDVYQALPVELGRRDPTQVEVLSGLETGARVVVGNSYLVKADIEKSGASHDH